MVEARTPEALAIIEARTNKTLAVVEARTAKPPIVEAWTDKGAAARSHKRSGKGTAARADEPATRRDKTTATRGEATLPAALGRSGL